MKETYILILFLLISISAKAQKFYVEKADGGIEQPVIDKLISNNYKITFKKDSANYVIMCMVDKTSMGAAKCSVAIIDNKTGDLLAKSKQVNGQTSLFNGYASPRKISIGKIADKYLVELIEGVIKKSK